MPNRRFGTANKFGTSNKFGASSAFDRKITFALEIDWDNDGLFDGYNEATNRMIGWSERRGREFVLNSGSDGFQPMNVGEITFTLLNIDRRYDPYYVAGDLYDYLANNSRVRFRVLDESTNTLYADFFGYVDDVRPNYGTPDTVQIVVKDGLKKLKETEITSTAVSSIVQYDDQIAAALTAAGWTEGVEIDDTLSDTMNYHWFRGLSAFDEIQSLVDATFGLFYVDAEGNAVYKSRISSDIAVMSLNEDEIDRYYGIRAPSPRDVVRNVVRVYARARKLQTAVEIWRLNDTPQIASGIGSPIWANYNYNGEEVPALSVTEPVSTTDYLAFDNADGTGTNRTANFSFARTGFATSSKLIPTNSGAAAYLTLFKLRGDVITPDNYTYVQEEDEESIAIYGRKQLTINSDWLQDVNTAADQAPLLLSRLSDPRQFPRVTIKKSLLDKQYTADLTDLVTVNFDSRDISAEMRVGYIERTWSQRDPDVIETIMYFEPNLSVSASGAWIFPITFPAEFG